MQLDDKWTLENIPPKGDKDVPDFAFNLFEIARVDKEWLNKPQDFLSNYALYRGKQSTGNTLVSKAYTPVNLYFSNVERTVANITARSPVGEVVDLDGNQDSVEDMFTVKLKKWWKDCGQQTKTRASARAMEIYGITIEKPFWDKHLSKPGIQLTDPFAFFPAPGLWDDMGTEPPFVCFAYLDFVDAVEAQFGVTGVAQEDAYELLGVEREKYKADNYNIAQQRIGNYEDPMTRVKGSDKLSSDKKIERCLIIEVWVQDKRKKTIKEDIFNPETGEIIQVKSTELVYPDKVRKITITKHKPASKTRDRSEYLVLDDSANPNINPALELELAAETHPWGQFPVYTANSYKDLISVWGFAAAEQVGDLVLKINLIVTKLIAYVINVMAPPLIVQKHCGISKSMIETSLSQSGRMVLMPTTPNARIEFMQIPNLPATFFQVLDIIISLFDRVYQIEDADRGQAPSGVIAASAIAQLQERNQEVRQNKIAAIDSLVVNKSKWAIGFWQNFGTKSETVEVGGDPVEFVGTDHAGRRFSYVVEAGSTTPRTSLHVEEMAQALFDKGAIDRRALLETINFQDWKQIIERMGETELDAALQVLIAAGLPEEQAVILKDNLMQIQGGPGDTAPGSVPRDPQQETA